VSLANGIKQLSIPGPSVLPEAVLNAMHQPSPNIYAGSLVDLANSLYPDLCKVARTEGDAVIYIGNGHAAWEASLTNTLSRGDKVLALVTGRFTLGWIDIAEFFDLQFDTLDFGNEQPVDATKPSFWCRPIPLRRYVMTFRPCAVPWTRQDTRPC